MKTVTSFYSNSVNGSFRKQSDPSVKSYDDDALAVKIAECRANLAVEHTGGTLTRQDSLNGVTLTVAYGFRGDTLFTVEVK